MTQQAVTAARVDIVTNTNVTFGDAFQFGTPGDTSWTIGGQNFRMDIKSNKYTSTTPLLTLQSASGDIIVDDTQQRVIHFNVPETSFSAAGVIPGTYDYDLIMYDALGFRVMLMYGKFKMVEGVTGG